LTEYGHWAVGHSLMDGLVKRTYGPSFLAEDGGDFSDAAKGTKSLTPPPPPGAKVHAGVMGRMPLVEAKTKAGEQVVRINGVDWQSAPGAKFLHGVTLFSSPWQEAGEMLRLAVVDRNTE